VQKLAQIVHASQVRSITVVRMEVPCCMGLMQIAQAAIELANADCSLHEAVVSIGGVVQGTRDPLPVALHA
jgi:hypothetical protein